MENKFVITYFREKETDTNVKTLTVYGKNIFLALQQAVNLISTVGYTENNIVKIEKV